MATRNQLASENTRSDWHSAIRLMRYPFSLFLMPVFWFAVSIAGPVPWLNLVGVFLILHGLVYPASNGYNSWYDRDTGSIGGLKHPPAVTAPLMILVRLSDGLALILGFLIAGPVFTTGLLVYILASRAYSHPAIRLKKYPLISTAVVTVFQGFWTFMTVLSGLQPERSGLFTSDFLIPAGLSTLFLLGSYPLTQIYQHAEDTRRGDRTLIVMLGIAGTFWFARLMLTFSGVFFAVWLFGYHSLLAAGVFGLGVIPILIYFETWAYRAQSDPSAISFERTMRMNQLSSVCMTIIFILHWLLNGWQS